MAVKQYGYYIKGNKVAIVEKDTQFDNDTSSRDFGPGSERAQWKSPKSDVTDGLEIEYVYSPEYRINDVTATVTCEGYQEKSGTGLLQIYDQNSNLPTSGITHVVIKGHERWNGLHKINEFTSNQLLTLETKYNVDSGAITNESFTVYIDVDVLNDESDEVRVSSYLSKAIVYYVKARVAEDTMNIEAKEYFMKEFRKMLEKHNNTRVGGLRITAVGSHGII
tara:strand:+ start:906 stop:1571 length:666 start_codon:yes stop_codon:yes gene_type:complete